jgi:hypothetical protein
VVKVSLAKGPHGLKKPQIVRIEGLRMFISPASDRNDNPAPPTGSAKPSAVIIDELIADGALVEFAAG